ncbi:MAG: hypothetical protein LBF09_07450 [Odoribacteraceae bacterium]|nr:hypothetical protein [Odoribacteraceae bacterium]
MSTRDALFFVTGGRDNYKSIASPLPLSPSPLAPAASRQARPAPGRRADDWQEIVPCARWRADDWRQTVPRARDGLAPWRVGSEDDGK